MGEDSIKFMETEFIRSLFNEFNDVPRQQCHLGLLQVAHLTNAIVNAETIFFIS